jgi:GTP pyrophosphokinase
MGVSLTDLLPELLKWFRCETAEDFYASLGFGGISLNQIGGRVALYLHRPEQDVEHPAAAPPAPQQDFGRSIRVLGTGDVLTQIARCCSPVPGDGIVGYVTRARGVSIHRADCVNVVNSQEKERLVDVEWGERGRLFPVAVKVEAWDRVGLLRDISTVVADEKVNIASMRTDPHADHTVTTLITLETTGVEQLLRLFSKIEGVHGVFSVARETDAAVRDIA